MSIRTANAGSSWHEMIDMNLNASVTIRERIDDLYRSDSRRVFASLVRLLNDFDLADDAMHEAFAAAVEIWERDRGAGKSESVVGFHWKIQGDQFASSARPPEGTRA